ncbi:hypothetical protein [Natronorarus salvus]|uniref:hypothetical protein n=1 Tax=Natronorarus salvus TaxID=3117733 RepID=UPI002F2640DD
MISPTQVATLYVAAFFAALGLAEIRWFQVVSFLQCVPFGTENDGLTDAGSETYRRTGVFYLAIARLSHSSSSFCEGGPVGPDVVSRRAPRG